MGDTMCKGYPVVCMIRLPTGILPSMVARVASCLMLEMHERQLVIYYAPLYSVHGGPGPFARIPSDYSQGDDHI